MAEIPLAAPQDPDGMPEIEVASRPGSEGSRAYRVLAAHLEQELQRVAAHSSRSVLITSPRDEPARSYVAVNLAALFAEFGHRVLVVTGRGLEPAEGAGTLSESTSGGPTSTAYDVVAHARPSTIASVSSLALGTLFPTSNDARRGLDGFVDAAGEVVDLVVFEAALLSDQLGQSLLSAVDLSVVVCEAGRTPYADGFECQRLLTGDAFLPVFGLVLALETG
jgi:Mrp family chromosome partitioning ATPase